MAGYNADMDNPYAKALRRDLAAHVKAAMAADETIRTQARLAARAGVGQGSISRILNATAGVSLETLASVAQACGSMAYKLLMPNFAASLEDGREAQRVLGRLARVSENYFRGQKNEKTAVGPVSRNRNRPGPGPRPKNTGKSKSK